MNKYEELKVELSQFPATWLVTGVAGFIGSNLLESLLKLDQYVVGLDNFSTGKRSNLEEVASLVTPAQFARFQFIEGDIRSLEDCRRGMRFVGESERSVQYVLHQAALGSVPRSIADPISTNASNVDGFLNMLVAANDAKVRKFVYAASSSTYGDHPDLPKVEEKIGNPLSPYAVTKYVNELYAQVFDRCYGLKSVGLRYFNVFGRRQDPDGAYAAVIPKWVGAVISDQDVFINGDGATSRDFCYVDNAVQANLLAATYMGECSEVLNVAVGDQTSLLELYDAIGSELLKYGYRAKAPLFRDFRAGDVMHSLADISKAEKLIGYDPQFRVRHGLQQAIAWYVDDFKRR